MTEATSSLHTSIKINDHSVQVWIFRAQAGINRIALSTLLEETLGPDFIYPFNASCRGVEIDRLPVILSTGCDVEPSDAPFFAGPLRKALEYGCTTDQVIQVFHTASLEPSWRECPAGLSAADRNQIEANYPTVIPSVDGSHLWFTRFKFEDTRAATDYERTYGYWIPGDPGKALAALILISEDFNILAEAIKSNVS
jgi:hypothetical protein